MFVLHFIFLPRINRSLRDFQESWNHHSISSEGSVTPYQLFVEGLSEVQDELERTNIPQGHSSSTNVTPTVSQPVEVPQNVFVPCATLNAALSTIDPLQQCSDHGAGLYRRAIQITGNHFVGNCQLCKTT